MRSAKLTIECDCGFSNEVILEKMEDHGTSNFGKEFDCGGCQNGLSASLMILDSNNLHDRLKQ